MVATRDNYPWQKGDYRYLSIFYLKPFFLLTELIILFVLSGGQYTLRAYLRSAIQRWSSIVKNDNYDQENLFQGKEIDFE